jgi:hypothetical protein
MTISIIGTILFSIFILLANIHLYWGLGGRWGIDAAAPSKENGNKIINPSILDCFAVAGALLACGFFILIKSQLSTIALPSWLMDYGAWAIAGVFLLRAIGEFKYVGFFKKIRSTEFGQADTKYYSPLCLAIAALATALALME